MSVLKVEKLTKSFAGLTAVSKADLHLEEGELVGLIGPNGAGKTTLFNLLTGIYEPTEGAIHLEINGKLTDIQGKKPYDICQCGVGRTFQNIRLFKDLTVFDNVRIAMNKNIRYGMWSSFFRLPSFYKEEARIEEETCKLLELFGLLDKRWEYASNLPYGEQRRLEIARALATGPSILLLDEPAAGMNPAETADLTEMISFIRKHFDLTILLIEHDMSLVMKICSRIYVLDYGQIIASGTPEEIKKNEKVIKAYLGDEVMSHA